MKKLLALFLVLMLVLTSVFTGVTVFAEDEVVEDTSEATENTEATQETATETEETVEDTEEVEEGEEEPAEESEAGETKEKKKLFGRKPKKDPKDEKIEELTDRVTRQMAEFDNFRKRTEKEKAAMYEVGAKSIIEKLLPIVDNFERGLAAVPEEQKEDSFVTGMEMVYKQIITTFEAVGVKPIEAVGREFDPALHNAVMQVKSEEYEAGVVAQELQKGYTYRDSVVRYSMVAVVSE